MACTWGLQTTYKPWDDPPSRDSAKPWGWSPMVTTKQYHLKLKHLPLLKGKITLAAWWKFLGTLPETNSKFAPENRGPLEKEISHLETTILRGGFRLLLLVSGRVTPNIRPKAWNQPTLNRTNLPWSYFEATMTQKNPWEISTKKS